MLKNAIAGAINRAREGQNYNGEALSIVISAIKEMGMYND
jgi:hypothetical protein